MMATSRPFAYNTGSTVSATTQIGDLAIGTNILPVSEGYGGLDWKNGPDEDLGYVIGFPQSGGTQPLPVSGTGYVQFWRSKIPGDDTSFINLAEFISRKYSTAQVFANGTDAKTWLNSNGFWTSYDSLPTPTATEVLATPTPTPTASEVLVTPTPTNTETPTNTPSVTPTLTPTNPALLQILNQTTGLRTVTSCTLDGVSQTLTSGSFPITAGNNGYALTHGASVNPNQIQFNFGGSGSFDLYSYKNGSLVNYLSNYNNSTYVAGGITLATSDQLVLIITDPGFYATPTPTATNLPPTSTPTNTLTPTNTPTPSTSPLPVTGYSFNLVALPYNFPTSGNSIMNGVGGSTSGSTEINVLATGGRGFYFNSIDSNGIDRTSYYSSFTGQNVTITFTQSGNTAIYSGDTNSFKYWFNSPNSGFVFGANVGVPPTNIPSGTATLVQSASTQYTIGVPVYVSLVTS